ncbi:hypothetical protein IWW38_004996 [Coemansia aciculifera]|uniref:Uncharacterized protein n=1 Tax=Coemansia aciculifera TaxID=417176 RepID=A0ACC1LWX0_9FUNG|nr:hypothetical protein IWW38_004996 [Coemansia aciculifera]
MSSWSGLSVAVPLVLGLYASFGALRSGASEWHTRLRKPKYNPSHAALMPIFALILTLEGMATYLVSNEMVLAQHTPELVAVRAGQLGLGFYWLQLTFLIFWPALLAFGPSLKLALANITVSMLFHLVAMVEFFRLTVAGGLLMMLCFFLVLAFAAWNAALIHPGTGLLPL